MNSENCSNKLWPVHDQRELMKCTSYKKVTGSLPTESTKDLEAHQVVHNKREVDCWNDKNTQLDTKASVKEMNVPLEDVVSDVSKDCLHSPQQKDSGIDDCSPVSYEGYCEGKQQESAIPVYPPYPDTVANQSIVSEVNGHSEYPLEICRKNGIQSDQIISGEDLRNSPNLENSGNSFLRRSGEFECGGGSDCDESDKCQVDIKDQRWIQKEHIQNLSNDPDLRPEEFGINRAVKNSPPNNITGKECGELPIDGDKSVCFDLKETCVSGSDKNEYISHTNYVDVDSDSAMESGKFQGRENPYDVEDESFKKQKFCIKTESESGVDCKRLEKIDVHSGQNENSCSNMPQTELDTKSMHICLGANSQVTKSENIDVLENCDTEASQATNKNHKLKDFYFKKEKDSCNLDVRTTEVCKIKTQVEKDELGKIDDNFYTADDSGIIDSPLSIKSESWKESVGSNLCKLVTVDDQESLQQSDKKPCIDLKKTEEFPVMPTVLKQVPANTKSIVQTTSDMCLKVRGKPKNHVKKKTDVNLGTNKVINSLFEKFSSAKSASGPHNLQTDSPVRTNDSCDKSIQSYDNERKPVTATRESCSSERNIFDLLYRKIDTTSPCTVTSKEDTTTESISFSSQHPERIASGDKVSVELADSALKETSRTRQLSGGNDFESATGESQFNFYDANDTVTELPGDDCGADSDVVSSSDDSADEDIMYSDCYLGEAGNMSFKGCSSHTQSETDPDAYLSEFADTPSKYVNLSHGSTITESDTPMKDMLPFESDIVQSPQGTFSESTTNKDDVGFQCEFAKFLQKSEQIGKVSSHRPSENPVETDGLKEDSRETPLKGERWKKLKLKRKNSMPLKSATANSDNLSKKPKYCGKSMENTVTGNKCFQPALLDVHTNKTGNRTKPPQSSKFMRTIKQRKSSDFEYDLDVEEDGRSSGEDVELDSPVRSVISPPDFTHCAINRDNLPDGFITSSKSQPISSRRQKGLLTSHGNLLLLRRRVCRLFHLVFPDIVYPTYFKANSCSVEALMDQVISVLKHQGDHRSKYTKMEAIPSENSCIDVKVVLCKSPRKCIRNLRKKVIQLLKCMLPQLELSPSFNVTGSTVDELLKTVILFNTNPNNRRTGTQVTQLCST